MTPEDAWTLKVGEKIVGISQRDFSEVFGVVQRIDPCGMSYEEYVAGGAGEIEARAKACDGPTVLMQTNDNEITAWTPKFVERVTLSCYLKCATCRVAFSVELSVRTYHRMSVGDPPSVYMENYPLLTKAMVIQSKCAKHASPEELHALYKKLGWL